MKHFLALLTAVLLMLCSLPAIAESITWAEVSDAAQAYDEEAQFVDIADLGLKMWVPADFINVELHEESLNAGCIAFLMTEDASRIVSVNYMEMACTLSEFASEAVRTEGYTDVAECVINNIPCVTLTDVESDLAMVVFATDAGYAITFSFTPISDEAFQTIAALMMASIQAE